jgi:hypothetical protein
MRESVYARSGNEWDQSYMESLGISVREASNDREFFGFNLPDEFLRHEDISILNSLNLTTLKDIETECRNRNNPPYVLEVLHALLQVLYYSSTEESAVDDLGKAMMRLVGIFGAEGLTMSGPKQIPMMMCGETKYANPDIVIQKIGSKVLLLVQEDKRAVGSSFLVPEPQLAAEMIAAFGHNRSKYKVTSQTMYGIIMLGSLCTFYKCDIDTSIHSSIQMGYRQDEPIMNIARFSLTDSESTRFMIESKDNMCNTLRCYEAIRVILSREAQDSNPP